MFVEVKTITVQPGMSDLVVENVQRKKAVTEMEGFLDKSIYVRTRNKDEEKVMIAIRWKSEQAYKEWKKSPVHVAGHRQKTEKPAYILGVINETFTEVPSTTVV